MDPENLPSETAGHANVKFPRLSPLRLFAPSTPQLASAGGGMMFSRSSGGGTGGGNDDDYGFQDEEPAPPRNSRSGGGGSGNGGRQRTVQFEPEERYWTEYLRIALPVIGLLLMLGLFWYWAQNLINDGNSTEPTATEQMIGAPGIITPTAIPSTPEPTFPVVVPTRPAATQPPATSNPTANASDNQAGAVATPPAASGTGEIAIDSKVVTNDVVNLRPDASTSGTPITQLKKGEELTVIAGPQTGEGYTWWQVRDANGNEGWVFSDGITLAP